MKDVVKFVQPFAMPLQVGPPARKAVSTGVMDCMTHHKLRCFKAGVHS